MDKTRFVEMLENEDNQYHFFVRPLKFGKTLFLSVLEYYYNADSVTIEFGLMFCFLAKDGTDLKIHNQIFEIWITNYYITESTLAWRKQQIALTTSNDIIKDNIFNMELCLSKFKQHYAEIYTTKDLKFLKIFDVVVRVGGKKTKKN